MSHRLTLSAVGVDRPGIVAAVSGALAEHQGNIEDSTMTILGGHFAVVLILSVPDDVTAGALEGALASVVAHYDLVVMVRELTTGRSTGKEVAGKEMPGREVSEGDEETASWVVSVHGADHPGIVHGITTALAAGGGNIVDLSTHLVGEAAAPVYVMTMRLTAPAGASPSLAERARQAADALGVHCSVHLDAADVL